MCRRYGNLHYRKAVVKCKKRMEKGWNSFSIGKWQRFERCINSAFHGWKMEISEYIFDPFASWV